MDNAKPGLRIALAVVGGLIVVIVLTLVVLMFSAGGGQDAAITDTVPTTTTTVAPTTSAATTTSTVATTTTAAPTTTTTTTTTTVVTSSTIGGPIDPTQFETSTKTAAATGDPGSALTDIRLGDHTTFTRIVFDFDGDGTPAYEVGFETGPTFSGSGGGTAVSPRGSAFLAVHVFPGLTHDVADSTATYTGPTSFAPGLGAIEEIVFIDDFEADMLWVIGLDGVTGFDVSTRVDPQRLVIDIAN